MVLTRSETKQYNYWKIIGNNRGHFPYHLGINSLEKTGETFNELPICGPGGLYYTTAPFIFDFLEYGSHICRVHIPTDARTVQIGNKFKSDKIEILNIVTLDPKGFAWLERYGVIGNRETLDWYIRFGDVENVKWLLTHIPVQSSDLNELFCLSAEFGHITLVQYLLTQGVDVHAYYDRALCVSATHGHLAVVESLLLQGANVHAQDDEALCWSARNGHLAVVECLLAHGADVHAQNDTALRWSARYDHLAVVECLLAHGADVHAQDDEALQYSAEYNNLALMACLLSHCADVHALSPAIVNRLRAHGIDIKTLWTQNK